jgi:hypothetical protein
MRVQVLAGAAGLLILALVVGACTATTSSSRKVVQGSGVVTTATRAVSGFTAVVLDGQGTVDIQVDGERETLQIEAEDNILAQLETVVNGNTLTIRTAQNVDLRPTQPVLYRLTVRDLTALELSGAGSITAEGISTDRFQAVVNGMGTITVAGSADTQEVRVQGAGNYAGEELDSTHARVDTNGTG